MLTTAGICIFPWDFADEGVDVVLDTLGRIGVNRLYLASVYHAGYFIHPHNPVRRVRLLEDGVAYFHPDERCYAGTPMKPRVGAMCARRDWFGVACEAARGRGIGVTAWTVCTHNTRLGLLHPACAIHNAFGDPYPHALSPADPAVRGYLRGLVEDLSRYPLETIFLEAPDHRGRKHGHHHERLGTHLGPLEERLFDVSFNAHDVAAGEAAGVDVAALRRAIREHLDRYLAAAPQTDLTLPTTVEAFAAGCRALTEYQCAIREGQESLLAELSAIAGRRSITLDGVGDSPAGRTVLVGAYGETAARVARITREARSRLRPGQRLTVLLRIGFDGPGMGSPLLSEADTRDATRAAAGEGADGVVFYNYSECPRRSIEWIGPALREAGLPPRRDARTHSS